jgi:hypothetical protein
VPVRRETLPVELRLVRASAAIPRAHGGTRQRQ